MDEPLRGPEESHVSFEIVHEPKEQVVKDTLSSSESLSSIIKKRKPSKANTIRQLES